MDWYWLYSSLSRLWLWNIHLASFVYWSSHIKATHTILLLQQTEIGPKCTCRLYCKMLFSPLNAAWFLLSIFMVLVSSFYSISTSLLLFFLPYLHLDQSLSSLWSFMASCYINLQINWTLISIVPQTGFIALFLLVLHTGEPGGHQACQQEEDRADQTSLTGT